MQLIPLYKKKEKPSDEKLLTEYLKTRDMGTLGELYKRHMHLVYGICLKYFKERTKSQDTVIQIFEKLLIEIDKQQIRNFKNWLYVVSKNYCLMEIRKTKPGKVISIADENEMAAFMENVAELHPIDREQDEIGEQALNNCIEKLKNEQKNCIRLFYFESKSYREIGIILNLEEKKIKSFIQNGKRNLKICLEGNNAKK